MNPSASLSFLMVLVTTASFVDNWAPAATQDTRDSVRYRTEDVRYQNGSTRLAALLMVPQSSKPVPAVVIVQGSGASDRTNQWARAIAETVVQTGTAVLLTDKRGVGGSAGDWRTSGFDVLAADALAGVELLAGRAEVDAARIGLIGLSQGGAVAPIAAARSNRVAFVINVSGAAVSFAEQTFTEMANTARQAGLRDDEVRQVLELNRAVAKYLMTGNWDEYARIRGQGLQTNWKNIAAGFPGSPDAPIWSFFRSVADYDPIPYWIQLTQPVLVLYGEEDERDNVPVAESVRRLQHAFQTVGKTNYRIVVIAGAGHGFMDHQRHALLASFVEELTSWVRTHSQQ